MTFLTSHRLRHVLFLAALVTLFLMLFALCAGAEVSCGHNVPADENGFCTEVDCGIEGYELPELNIDGVYEIGNVGELYWFFKEVSKRADVLMRAKLTAHIVVNPDLLDAEGNLNAVYTEVDGEGKLVNGPIHWLPSLIKNVEFDGDGYTISGLYAVRNDGYPTGLFSTAENATIQNVGILDSYFSSGNAYTGAILGEGRNDCLVKNCFSLGCTLLGKKAAALVGKLGYISAKSYLSYGYTDKASVIYECVDQNVVSHCYYLAATETDELEGTTHVTALSDEDDTLLHALSTTEREWMISCVRNVPVMRGDHKYAFACLADCEICGYTRKDGEEGKLPHVYDHKCDYTCNRCDRVNQERFESKDVHYFAWNCATECSECHVTRQALEDHKYSNACDKYCNYCAYQRVPPVQNHQYTYACDQYCKICHYNRGTAADAHVFDSKCDMVCNVCAITREGEHVFDNTCDVDCNDCGYIRTITHTFGEYVVVENATHFKEGVKERACSVCGYKETAAIEKLAGWPLWLILLVSIGGGVSLLVAAFALYWFVVKGHSFAQLIGRSPRQLKEKERRKKAKQRLLEAKAKAAKSEVVDKENNE